MKKYFVGVFTIILCIGICNISVAQGWRKLADKVKEVKGKVEQNTPVGKLPDSINEVKTQVESSIPASNFSTAGYEGTSANAEQNSGALSGGIDSFLQAKYSIIKASESNLNLNSLGQGDLDPKKHNEGAKKLDYAKTVAHLNAEGKLLMTDRKYGEVMSYGKSYLKVYADIIKPYTNKAIEEAYAVKSTNKNQAIEIAHNAQLVAEAAALILYDSEDAKQLKADADKALQDIGGEYYSKLYVSDFHKNNIGKILFSTRPITPGKEDATQFVTSVTGTDKLYAIAYFNGKIKDLGDMISYKISIDGNNNQTPQFTPNTSDLENSYYLVEIMPDPNIALHQFDPVQFAKVLSTLSPRKHVMNCELVFGYGEKSASGTISLDWANANGEAILANSQAALQNAKDNKARNMQLPEYFARPSKSFTSTDLTTDKIKAAIMANGDYSENIKQIKKVVIGDKFLESVGDWIVRKNDLGIPTHKESNREIYILFEGNDGWCYFSDKIIFKQDYSGAGTYEETRLEGFRSDLYTRIACKNSGKK